MKKTLIAMSVALFTSGAFASGSADWSYSGDTGPDNWVKLSPEYSECAGSNQSPINITGLVKAELEPVVFNYDAGSADILNNGHTVQINTLPGSSIIVDDIAFELKQFHFHVPSENQLHSKSFPMEGHLVHADKHGNLAVVAVLVTEGQANEALAKAWAQMPKKGETLALTSDISPLDILPSDRAYYRFNGSLTTPPCSEGVRWIVMKQTISASKEQIEEFLHVVHHHNNRPVQAINARKILE
ncbi:carbonic anhydrase [Nitrincola sp. MINF-07-Sa-05]|uniref:carbonic anhydrase n=1 Tax=Nitrincola salilacus TaxID=3400273 RepID=UPI003917F002